MAYNPLDLRGKYLGTSTGRWPAGTLLHVRWVLVPGMRKRKRRARR